MEQNGVKEIERSDEMTRDRNGNHTSFMKRRNL